MSEFNKIEFESDVHDLYNAIKVLSCVIGYSTEHPDGPPQRSDHNLDLARYQSTPPCCHVDRPGRGAERRTLREGDDGCSTARIEHNDSLLPDENARLVAMADQIVALNAEASVAREAAGS